MTPVSLYLRKRNRTFSQSVFVLLTLLLLVAVYATAYLFGSASVAGCGQAPLEPSSGPATPRSERHDHCGHKNIPLRDGAPRGCGPHEAKARHCGGVADYVEALKKERTQLQKDLRRACERGDACAQRAQEAVRAVARELEARMRSGADTEANTLARRCAASPARYSIVFDAGSTGSRVHVFRYRLGESNAQPARSPLRLEHELFEENHNPLSGFADPAAAAASLRPLVASAKAAIPKELHACVPIELKATAGLRQIGASRAAAVLREVQRLFAAEPFRMRSGADAVRILEGREEGPLAWITVNFLRRALHTGGAPPATIIDLGGGSAQIVMLPKDPALIAAQQKFTHRFTMNGRSFLIYQHSYEGNGLHAAKRQVLKAIADLKHKSPANDAVRNGAHHSVESNTDLLGTVASPDNNKDAELADAFPCLPRGYSHNESGVSNVRNGGTPPSLDACRALIRRYVVRTHEQCGSTTCGFNGAFQPKVNTASDGPVYAFSFFVDRLKPHMTAEEEISVQGIGDIAQRVCSRMGTAQEISAKAVTTPKKGTLLPEMECFELSYLYTLVHDGFGFAPEQILRIAKKIDGFETSWALGASLITLED